MNLHYSNFYKNLPEDRFNREKFAVTLFNHLKRYDDEFQYKNVLEIGCGLNPLLANISIRDYLGVDINSTCIELNKQKYGEEFFLVANVLAPLDLNANYDYIVDAHFLHCLALKKDRDQFYQNLKSIMKPQTVYIGEMLCYHEDVKIPFDYMFDGESIFKMDQKLGDHYFENGLFPYRSAIESRNIEKEFSEAGFIIDNFMVRKDLRINIFTEDYFPEANWPYICQFALKLPNQNF